MGGDETDEYCLYPKLSSHLLPLWIQAGKKDYILIQKPMIFSVHLGDIVIISYIIKKYYTYWNSVCQIESPEIKRENFNLIDDMP